MQLTSSNFRDGEMIPIRFTCEGENVSPEFSWKEVPEATKAFALIMQDAQRPGGFTHWVLYNIPGYKGSLDPEIPNQKRIAGIGMQGRNDKGEIGYTGPCPRSGMHRYLVRLFALESLLSIEPGADQAQLTKVMEGHILAEAELIGTYRKQSDKAA
jgi:Raf kinase inhibitor-like YbhB/YbcL family protein